MSIAEDRTTLDKLSVQDDSVDINSILKRFEQFGVHLGLERVQKLLANLGNPHHQVPIIHVAGTNGKGSVCAYLSAVLTQAGYRVGRYTSPHLVDWCERICLNEQPISLGDLQQLLQQVEAAIPPDQPSPTQFEVITAAAWLYFAQRQVDIAVVEVGLGGRLDATNVCDRPLVSIITSISREHWQVLGSTLAEIAREKAGILKPGGPAVVGLLPPEARAVVKQRIAELGCSVVWPEPARDRGAGWAEYQGIQYPLSLQGTIQRTNSALAIAALQILQQQGWEISQSVIVAGMAKTKWPGRLQWTTWQNHRLLMDGAHNPAAAQVLRQFMDSDLGGIHGIRWVMGMLSAKDHAGIFKALLRPGDCLYLIPVPDQSSADPEALAKLALEICPDLADCQTYPDLTTGLQAAVSTSNDGCPSEGSQPASGAPLPSLGEATNNPTNRFDTPAGHLTVLCGSLYLVGCFLQHNQVRL